MQADLRRHSLANLQALTRQVERLRTTDSHHKDSLFTSIKTTLDLLHNDFVMVLNQNFYLQLKLAEKDKLTGQLEQRCSQLEESSRLSLHMAKQRYEKAIHVLRY